MLQVMHLYTPPKPSFYRHVDLVLTSDKIDADRKYTLPFIDIQLMSLEEFNKRWEKHVKDYGEDRFSHYYLITPTLSLSL